MGDQTHSIPLCVDLDGTLLRSDSLHEALILLAKKSPGALPALPIWLRNGKAHLKHLVADRVDLDAGSLPYCEDILGLIREAREGGRPVVLVTAAPARVAAAVAQSLGLFDEVLSSDEKLNLAHHNKADVLVRRYGRHGFDYIGDSNDDLPVFENCRRAFLVSSNNRLKRAADRLHQDVTHIDRPKVDWRVWVRALRVHQWLKNLLIFIPLLASGQFGDLTTAAQAGRAFAAFSLFASAVYLLNDMVDLQSDRIHPTKRNRPFASGELSLRSGVIAVPLLILASLAISLSLPPPFMLVLAGYALITTVYSFALKRGVSVRAARENH